MISQWQLRAAFAARLLDMYEREVPAYTTLVDVSRDCMAFRRHRSRSPRPFALYEQQQNRTIAARVARELELDGALG
jgi:uncharacterized glyoxalase superfamily metalloenzyme YdcJ